MNISVCLIVKNEEDVLESALRSIPSNYEIVVVDTGSTDRTLEIAKNYGAKIGHFQWCDDFSQARNESIRLATGPYILALDADEQLPGDAEEKLEHFIRTSRIQVGTVQIRNTIGNEVHITRMIRFFPNRTEYDFAGRVHERIVCNGKDVTYGNTGLVVNHVGYEKELYHRKRKFERYEALYHTLMQENPNDGYLLYQFGKLYYSDRRFLEALPYFTQCLKLQEMNHLYFAPMLILYGYSLKELGRAAEAWTILSSYLQVYPSFPDLPFLLGLLAMDTGKIQEIEPLFKLALSIGETADYSSHVGVGSFKASYNLGVFYEVTGRIQLAQEYYRRSADIGYEPAVNRLQILFKRL